MKLSEARTVSLGLTLVTILFIEGSSALPCLLAFQKVPSHGSQTKSLGHTLITIFVVEQTPALPCHVALSRMPSQVRRAFYIQPARRFEGEWYTFSRGIPFSLYQRMTTSQRCPRVHPRRRRHPMTRRIMLQVKGQSHVPLAVHLLH